MNYKIEKDWQHNGYRCVVVRSFESIRRHRCGYVGIQAPHPLYGKDYDTPSGIKKTDAVVNLSDPVGTFLAAAGEEPEVSISYAANVHGGITYAGGENYPVDAPNTWWFGFDCAHFQDNEEGGRSLEYCVAECEKLADFLGGYAVKEASND